MDNALAIYAHQQIERKYGLKYNKRQVAADCGIEYQALVDVLRGHIKRPGPKVLEGLSAGLDAPYDNFALAAYGRMPPAKTVKNRHPAAAAV